MLKVFLKRFFPKSASATNEMYEKLESRLSRIEGILNEQVQRQLETDMHLEQMTKKLSQTLREVMDKYEIALETHRSWEEGCIFEAIEGHRKWVETLDRENRAWEAKFIDELIERHRQWEEAAIEGYRKWEEAAIEGYRQWEEAAHETLRSWGVEAIRNENRTLLCSEENTRRMLESLWNVERKVLPGGELMAPILAHKAYADWTEREVEKSLKDLDMFSKKTKKPLVMFCGDYVIFPNEAPCRYIESMSKQYPQYDYLLMSEASWLTSTETAERIQVPFQIVPHEIGAHYFTEKMDIPLKEEDSKQLHESEVLCVAVKGLMNLSPETSMSFAEFTIWTAYRYYLRAFQTLRPKLIFVYNNFYYFHSVIDCVAKEMGIEVVFWEYGPIPGTFMFDRHGLLSTGFPSLMHQKFCEFAVTEKEYEQASELFDYLKRSKINRYVQKKSEELEKLKEELTNTKKPVILYIDQIDAECGMLSDAKHVREHVCPSFGSVEEGLQFISEIARRNEWKVIYKLHPIRRRVPEDIPEDIHVIHKCDINELIDLSDVTIAILSSVCFSASVRERPVVLLGYNEMRGKGCVYEAYDRAIIEKTIMQAIRDGVTDEMKRNFIRYIALMNKYYLYDDNRPRDMRYGKKIEQFFEDRLLWA